MTTTPPVAATRPHSFTRHGVTIHDPWAWPKDPNYPDVDDKDVLAYQAENAHFEAQMAPHRPLVDRLYEEMKAHIADKSTVPQKDGDRLLDRLQTPAANIANGGAGRSPVAPTNPPRQAGAGGRQGIFPPRRLLDLERRDQARLCDRRQRFRALHHPGQGPDHRRAPPDVIEGMLSDIVWTADDGFLYGLANKEWRTDNARLHRLGTDPMTDVELYHEDDKGYRVAVGETSDRRWIVIATGDHVTSEIRLYPANDPLAAPILVAPRQPGREYDVDTHGDTLFIHTNDTDPMWRLVTAPITSPGEWTERIARPGLYMTSIKLFADFFVVEGREDGLDQVEIHPYDGGTPKRIAFPEASYAAGTGDNPEYDQQVLRLGYSPWSPPARCTITTSPPATCRS
ncbi:hypothetical protein AB5I41_25385 [Sphingomonas sp. MMS24-JH45]